MRNDLQSSPDGKIWRWIIRSWKLESKLSVPRTGSILPLSHCRKSTISIQVCQRNDDIMCPLARS